MKKIFPLGLLGLGLLVFQVAGCASNQPVVDPFELADGSEESVTLLDEPIPTPTERRSPRRIEGDYHVSAASSQPARSINADPNDWDLSDLRWFEGAQFVEEGRRAWRDKDDASFGVAVDADESHLYFWIEVIDDVIVDSDPQNPLDGVVIWLRDPGLVELLDTMPTTLRNRVSLRPETAIVITPRGEVARYGSATALPPGAVHVATAPIRSEGYVVEVAISLEVFPLLKNLPIEEVAFRVEMLDSDEVGLSEPAKRLSMLPRAEGGSARFALYSTPGLRPAISPDVGPPRYDALGLWQLQRDRWVYRSFEYHSPGWRVMEDLREVASGVVNREALPAICTGSGNAMWLVEAYQATRGGQRVALVLCGTDTERSCPASARSQLVFTSIVEEQPGEWRIEETHNVFPEDLRQCPFSGSDRQRVYSGFSLLPLDVVGSSLWGVGWHLRVDENRDYQREAGVYIVDPQAPSFRVGHTQLKRVGATGTRRWENHSQVFMIPLQEGDERMGVCEIEVAQDLECRRFNEQCEPLPRGREVLTHVKNFNPERRRFEEVFLRPHPRCRPSLQMEEIGGFEIFLVEDRLGLLR